MVVGVYTKPVEKLEYTARVPVKMNGCGSIGAFYIDVADCPESNKVLLVVPGVTGDSSDNYVQDLAGEAVKRGYNVVEANMHVHKNESGDGLKLVDVADHKNNHHVYE